MMTVLQTRAGWTNILIRRKLGEKGSSPTGPRQDVALVGNARRSVMKQNRSATTACVATLSAQDMQTKSHGPKKALRRHLQHCRPKSACLPLRYQLIMQDVTSAIRCTFLIVNRLRSRTRSPPAAMVFDPDLSALMSRNANHREFSTVCNTVRSLTRKLPERQIVGRRAGLNHRDTNQSIHHLRLCNVSTILVCTTIRHRP
jgi:hypothetical protein